MEVLLIVFLILLGIAIYFLRSESHETRIKEEVKSRGGILIEFKRCNIFTGLGPFMVVGKGRVVYKINYEINGIKKEAWVRFGGITGADWRW